MPERLNTLIKWGEGPHMCAMAVIPFALAFSLLAFRRGKPWTVAAAALCCALVVTDNLYGAYALGIFFPVLVWSEYVSHARVSRTHPRPRDRHPRRRPVRLVADAIVPDSSRRAT